MSEHRFRDPQGNEWITIDTPGADILAGYPVGTIEIPMVPIEGPELDAIKDTLKAAIDSSAEIERMKYITAGAGQAMTYMQKADEASRYLATVAKGETPAAADYPLLSAEVGITAATIGEVAAVVNGAFIFWQQKGAAIEAARLGAKAAIDAASTAADAQAAADGVMWP